MSQNIQDESSFFDQLAVQKFEYSALKKKCFEKLFFELSKSISSKQKINIIDLGCGTGNFTSKLLSLNGQIYGCDISKKSIKIANELYPKVNFSIQNIEKLSFEDNYFDIVIFSGVLHHFDDLSPPLIEAKRILKKDGTLFAYDPNLHNPFYWLLRRKNSMFYSNEGVTKNEEPLTKNKIIKAMQLQKFKNIQVYGLSSMPFESVGSNKLSYFMPLYNFVDYLLNIVPYVRNIFGSFLITKGRK